MNWEYKTITFSKRQFLTGDPSIKELTDKLNQQGDQGWELVNVLPPTALSGARSFVAIFKRPK